MNRRTKETIALIFVLVASWGPAIILVFYSHWEHTKRLGLPFWDSLIVLGIIFAAATFYLAINYIIYRR